MAIELERVGWQNNVTTANETNLKKMEDNTEEAVNEVDSRIDGITIFESSSGAQGNVNFSQSIDESFKKLEIQYVVAISNYKISKIETIPIIIGNNIELGCIVSNSAALQIIAVGRYVLKSTGFEKQFETQSRIKEGNTVEFIGNSNAIYVTKVIAYK